MNMKEPTEEEIKEFTSMGENSPTSRTLNSDEQKSVLDAIANAEIREVPKVAEEKSPLVDCTETCPHCDTEFTFAIPENRHIAICPKCKKSIVVCDKCSESRSKCSDCIWCDVANFTNLLRGNVTIEQFLGAMNPPLSDMTTSSNPMFVPTYDSFVNEIGGDDVNWDVKYWEIYGKIVNAPVSEDSSETEILKFVESLIEKNRE